jgi:hypothetical protein
MKNAASMAIGPPLSERSAPGSCFQRRRGFGSTPMTSHSRFTARVLLMPNPPNTQHFQGVPPAANGGVETRTPLDTPVLLVIEVKTDGVFLFRFSTERRCVGDTWHRSVDEAKSQAEFEFNELTSVWKVVPEQTDDVFSFGFAD